MNEILEQVIKSIEKIMSDGKIDWKDIPELFRLIPLMINLVKEIIAKKQ